MIQPPVASMSPWRYITLPECDSTFNAARHEPPWCVVRAVRQSSGRGRFNRTWYGEEGGMWATFNVPLEGQGEWGLLPLVAGVAIMRALRGYAIPGLRLRWPNDVLVGRAKLAGILVERPLPTLGSIGIGLNMHNDVCSLASRVQDPPARLADLVPDCPPVPVFTAILAEAIRSAFTDFTDGGFSALEEELQAAWGSPRPVLAHTDSGLITGSFLGILPDGSPRLAQADGRVIAVPALAINRLQEA